MDRAAVVTGVGAVTPLGASSESTWRGIETGESGITEITRFDPAETDLTSRVAGEADFDPDEVGDIDERRTGRYAQLALAASQEAVDDAGLDPDGSGWQPERVGVSIGSGVGGFPEIEEGVNGRIGPTYTLRYLPNLAAGHVSERFGAEGPNRAPATACAAGTHAVGSALRDIRAGRADVVVAGGCESAVCPAGMRGFDAMRALSTRNDDPSAASRPFDADRDGFVMAEGAGVLVLEARERALDRDADIRGELTGFARTADAHHPTRPPEDAHGLERCLEAAIDDAGRTPDDIDHVNAHGTSTPRGDPHEATAIQTVFDDPPPVTSVKSMTGHTMGASGAIEAVVTVHSIEENVRPPTINYQTPDPACDVPVVEAAESADVTAVASNSAGFGGTNGTLVFEVSGRD